MDRKQNYWGFRVKSSEPKSRNYLYEEVQNGWLRQGWGYDERQNLRNQTLDEGAQRNRPIFNRVKQGDYLFVPNLPFYGMVTIVKAREDFDYGYQYEISKEHGDFGHMFPVEYVKIFNRSNNLVKQSLRSTLMNRLRFWRLSADIDELNAIIDAKEDLTSTTDIEVLINDFLSRALDDALDNKVLENRLSDFFGKQFHASQWEYVIIKILTDLYPNYEINHIGGISEKKHGCDIEVSIPGIAENEYVIGIQVKDYRDLVNPDIVNQVLKADNLNEDNRKLIDKYLLITHTNAIVNPELVTRCKENGIKILFEQDVIHLLTRAAKKHLGK